MSDPSGGGRSDHSAFYRAASAAAHRVQPLLLAAWRRSVLLAAADRTLKSTSRSCLVVAPHPDDETLGCGATIARKRAAGTPVTVVIAADGRYSHRVSRELTPDDMRAVRAKEAIAACAALGVDAEDVVQLGHEDTQLARSWAPLVTSLRETLRRVDPDEVLVVSGLDHHPDHRTLNAAVYHVLQTDGRPRVAWEFPVWAWMDGPWIELSARPPLRRAAHLVRDPAATLLRPRPATVSTEGFLAAKQAALAAYRSQTTNLTGEASWPVMDDGLLGAFLGPCEVFLAPLRGASSSRFGAADFWSPGAT
jgi:LmbE family N-acetylglucosaminyl deacetylase